MLLETLALDFVKVRQTSATDASFPSRLPQVDRPSGVGNSAAQATASAVFNLVGGTGEISQNALMVKPFAVGNNNTTFSMRVIAWTLIRDNASPGDPNLWLWDPTILCELACTISSTVKGIAGRTVTDTDYFADTIALTTGNDDISISIVSPANDTAGYAVLDLVGPQMLEFTFSTGSSATSCNCLMRKL